MKDNKKWCKEKYNKNNWRKVYNNQSNYNRSNSEKNRIRNKKWKLTNKWQNVSKNEKTTLRLIVSKLILSFSKLKEISCRRALSWKWLTYIGNLLGTIILKQWWHLAKFMKKAYMSNKIITNRWNGIKTQQRIKSPMPSTRSVCFMKKEPTTTALTTNQITN